MAFTPRLSAPDQYDKRWIQVGSGGWNQCIYGYWGAPSVLPNCTGYVHGRVMEIRGASTDDSGLSFGNAIAYYNGSTSNWTHSQDPEEGAVMCWGGNGGYGHVAVVEQIIDNNTLILSESSWGTADNNPPAVYFRTLRVYRGYGWRSFNDKSLIFQGFLLNPYLEPPTPPEPPEPPGPPAPTGSHAVKLLLLYKLNKKRRSAYGRRKRSDTYLL